MTSRVGNIMKICVPSLLRGLEDQLRRQWGAAGSIPVHLSRMLRVEGVQRESPGRLLDPKDHPYTKSRRLQDVSTIAPNATHRPSLARIGGRRVAGLFCTEHKSPSILEYLGSITVPKQTMTSIRNIG